MLPLLIFICVFCFSTCSKIEGNSVEKWKRSSSGTILALGDSLTAWYWLPQSESYPSQLEKKLNDNSYNYRIINAWISWDTTAWLLARIDWVLEGGAPSVSILCIGSNDAFQWKPVEEIERNIRTIIERIQSKNIPILFAWMKAPLNLGPEYATSYEWIFPKIAKEYNIAYIPFLLEWVALNPELNQEDRIHPTASWYAVVTNTVYNALIKNNLIFK